MKKIAIIGGGPSGLMAAEILASSGLSVTIYDQMPTVGRKFLMAGRGGLNLTHSEPFDSFMTRYGSAAAWLKPVLEGFPPSALLDWCHNLGQPTFVGTSGRVFPKDLKASPLLRAWLRRLDSLGVTFALKRRWLGWDAENRLVFLTSDQKKEYVKPDATLLALGGASWPRLGSDGQWVKVLEQLNIDLTPLTPANSGFVVPWSESFRQRFEGQPLKPITALIDGEAIQGEALITSRGIEGSLIYRLSKSLKEKIASEGSVVLTLDLRPGLLSEELFSRLQSPRGSQSLSNYLRKQSGLSPVAISLLYEFTDKQTLLSASPEQLTHIIKACPIRLLAPCSLGRAISTAGGIRRSALDEHFMFRAIPGVFATGEMLDWEAPTGGYLLQACFSTAVAAAHGLLAWTNRHSI